MNLTWHIVKKDLRRMALPVGAWVAFVAVTAIWFSTTHMPEAAVAAHDLRSWIGSVGAFADLGSAMLVVTSMLLVGHLVIEDCLLGTTAFWQTRPIGAVRLVVAKLIAGWLLLAVAPLAVLVPVWLVAGFGAGELGLAAAEFAGWQIVGVVVATAFGAITRSLAQFFFATLAAALVYALALTPALNEWFGGSAGAEVEASRLALTLLAPVPLVALTLAFQSATRRTRDAWLLLGAGLVAIHAVRVSWSRDLTPWLPTSRVDMAPTAGPAGPQGGVAWKEEPAPSEPNQRRSVGFTVTGGPVTSGVLAPERGELRRRGADGVDKKVVLTRGQQWGEDAAMRLVGLRRDDGPIFWEMAEQSGGGIEAGEAGGLAQASGEVQLAWLRGRVLAELPLRVGAEVSEGSSLLRIAGLGEGVLFDPPCVIVEERDVHLLRDAGLAGGRSLRSADATRRDVFLLVIRKLGFAQCLPITEHGAANHASMLVSVRQLQFRPPETGSAGRRVEVPGWRDGAVLIKVRFELERRVRQDFTSAKGALGAEEKKP